MLVFLVVVVLLLLLLLLLFLVLMFVVPPLLEPSLATRTGHGADGRHGCAPVSQTPVNGDDNFTGTSVIAVFAQPYTLRGGGDCS